MDSNLSTDQMLTQLETKIARFEAFSTAAAAAGELLDRSRPGAPPQSAKIADEDLGKGRPLSRMIARILEDKAADEIFGPTAVINETNKRWGAKLRRKADPRSVAATLRRWAVAGRIHRKREGRAHYESLYVKQAPVPSSPS